MSEYLRKILLQIGTFLKGLPPTRKIALVFLTIVVTTSLATLFIWASRISYRPLMTNLAAEDASNIIKVLREKNIPFQIDPSGKNISVPSEQIYDLRLDLAASGHPRASVVGYEIFDKLDIGTTSYVQKVNHKRALEGELMRTIGTIYGVKRARVHLAIPKKSTFIEDHKDPSASVVLDLEPGTRLNERQIFGIGNLVSSAVEGLSLDAVMIVNTEGKTLSKNVSDPLVTITADQLDFQRGYENGLEERIVELLSRVVGEGKVVARVNATLDFSRVSETQTTYDGDSAAIRSVQKNDATMQGNRPGPYGAAGARSNTPGQPPAVNAAIKTDTRKLREVTNYEVPQTVRSLQKPAGTVKKMSVAVLVDGKRIKTEDADGKVLSKVEPWSPEKLEEFSQLVARTVALDAKRGDSLEIKNMEFREVDFDEAEKVIASRERREYIQNIMTYAIIGVIIILFFVFVVRPFIKWVTENTIDSVDSFLPQTIEELEKMQKNSTLPGLEETVPELPEKVDPDKVEGQMIKEKIITLVDSSPHKAALIVKEWVRSDRGKTEDPGKTKTA